MKLHLALRNAAKFRTVFDFGEREVKYMTPDPFSGRNPLFQESLDVRPHLLVLNKMDLADLSNKQVDLVDQVSDVEKFWMKKLFGFTVLKPTERYGHVLCGWIAGHESEYMETLTEQEVMHSITQLIRKFTGNPIITPQRILRSQWFLDPWTCGSYSYTATGCSGQGIDNLAEPLPSRGEQSQPLQVMFAGEATHSRFFSTVHGALLSGWREADRLISHYSSPNVSEPMRSKL